MWNLQKNVCTEKHVLILKKGGMKRQNMSLPRQAWVEKKSMDWKHTDFSLKKQLRAQRSVKKVMLTVLGDIKDHITI